MRLPRGTVVIICGGGGCIERTVTDYGPQDPARVVDLYKPDFFRICGCPVVERRDERDGPRLLTVENGGRRPSRPAGVARYPLDLTLRPRPREAARAAR